MTHFFTVFVVLLPLAILGQLVRSHLLKRPRSINADLLEAFGFALGLSLSFQEFRIFPELPAFVSSIVILFGVYFPFCFLADWIRKKARHDA